jgi:transcriptional regulator NrdR family protein
MSDSSKMTCPVCRAGRMLVVYARRYDRDDPTVTRLRRCEACGHRLRTREEPLLAPTPELALDLARKQLGA